MALTRAVSDFKDSVKAATTGANINLAAAPNTLDGVTLSTNDRVLVKDQSPSSLNGIYRVTTLGTGSNGSWTRASDFNDYRQISSGALTFVEQGAINGNIFYYIPGGEPNVQIGTTAITFANLYSFIDATASQNLQSVTNFGNTTTANITASNFIANSGGQFTGYFNGAIGANGANSGAFSTVSTTGNLTVGGNITITGNILPSVSNVYTLGSNTLRFANLFLKGNTIVLGSLQITDTGLGSLSVTDLNNNTLPIVMSAINNTPIGNATPSTGAFTTLSASNNITAQTSNIYASNIVGNSAIYSPIYYWANGISLANSITGLYSNSNVAAYLVNYNGNIGLSNINSSGTSTINAIIANGGATSTSTTTGALIVQGGAGISGNLYVGGNLSISGNTTFINTTVITTTDTISAPTINANVVGNTGASLYGTIASNVQPFITSVGTLTSLNSTGTISANQVQAGVLGNSGALITGSLTTASQANITSVGTLTNLTTSGNIAAQTANIYAANIIGNTAVYAAQLYWSNGATLASTITGTYSNSNVNSYLPTYSGTLSPSSLTTNSGGQVTGYLTGAIGANTANTGNFTSITTSGSGGNITGTNTGYIVSGYLVSNNNVYGNSYLWYNNNAPLATTITGTYSNSNVNSYLPTYSGTLSPSSLTTNNGGQVTGYLTGAIGANTANSGVFTTVTASGNITAQTANVYGANFVANTASYSPVYYYANGVNILNAITASAYSNANAASYLPTYNGNIGNLATGNLIPLANTSYYLGNSTNYYANAYANNFNAITQLATPKIQFTVGGASILEDNPLDLAIVAPYQIAIKPAAYQYTFNNNGSLSGPGGTFVYANGAVYGNITATGAYWANGVSFASTITGTYSNSNVNSYLPTYTGTLTPSSLTTNSGGQVSGYLTGAIGANTANSGAFTTVTASGALTAQGTITSGGQVVGYFNGAIGANTPNSAIFTNVTTSGNITAQTANVYAANFVGNTASYSPVYYYSNGLNILTPIVNAAYSNTNAAAYLTTYNGALSAANITTSGNITAQTANLYASNVIANTALYGAQYYWSNGAAIAATITGTYSNSNVASYLPIYSGTLSPSSLTTNSGGQVTGYLTGAIGANTPNNATFTTTSITNATNTSGLGTGALIVTQGGAAIQQDLYVGGNIYASNIISQTSQQLVVSDPLIYLSANSGSYNYEIGFYSHFVGGNVPQYAHTGFTRNHVDNQWYLFSNLPEPSGGVINLSSSNIVYDTLKLGAALIQNTTIATSTTSGALQVAGGAGISGAVYANNFSGVSLYAGTIGNTGSILTGTLSTAAQPNITSVGTLSSLTVSGTTNLQGTTNGATVNAVNLYATTIGNTATAISGNLVNASAIYAGTIGNTGTALVGTLSTNSQPYITSVGQLTSLNVTGTTTTNQLQAGLIGNSGSLLQGTLITAAQGNITSVGVLTSLTSTGTIAANQVQAGVLGNSGSLLQGTLITAAQGNITSVGTLTSLTSTGTIAANQIQAGVLGNSGALLTGTLTTAAQGNITSTGALTSPSFTTSGGGQLNGYHTGAIGANTPNSGAFTTLTASGTITGTGQIIGYFNGAIGANTANSGAFTTVTASSISSSGNITAQTANVYAANVIGNTALYGGQFYWSNGASLTSTITGLYSNSNVATYLPTYTGTLSPSSLTTNSGGQVTAYLTGAIGANVANSGAFTTVTATSTIVAQGTITSASQIVGYFNGAIGANTANSGSFTTLAASSNISAYSSLNVVGNIGAGNFVANTATYSPNFYWANGVSLANSITGTYSNSNVASYLPTYTGALTAGNVTTVNGGQIVGYLTGAIGANTPNSGAFTTLTASGNTTLNNYANIYIATGSTAQTSALTVVGNVYGQGGTGYLDFLKLQNTYSAATNPNKYFRIDNAGSFQVINSAYTNNIFNLTDAGALTVPSVATVGNLVTTSGVYWSNGAAYSSGGGGSGTPGGSNTMVQFNNSGTFTGATYLQYNLTSGNLVSNSTTQSTSTSTGALVLAGGLGVGGNIYAANILIGSTTTLTGVQNIGLIPGSSAYLTIMGARLGDTGSQVTGVGALEIQGSSGSGSGIQSKIDFVDKIPGGNSLVNSARISVTNSATATNVGQLVFSTYNGSSLVEAMRIYENGNIITPSTTTITYGTLSAVTVNGNTIGNTGSTIIGIIATNAQPYITSIGTLTGLTSSGNITAQTANVYAANHIANTATYSGAYYYSNGSTLKTGANFTTSNTAPSGASVGDFWYKGNSDVLYEYVQDAASNKFWLDLSSTTNNFSNLTASTATITSAAISNITQTFVPSSNASINIGSASGGYFNAIYAVTFSGTSTTAKYADLAEMYHSDDYYAPGTVMIFGGDFDVTISNQSHDTRIAGVVSTNPAYLMNDNFETDNWLPIALTGRVPCLVRGPVNKGTVLVSSEETGIACALNNLKYEVGCVIGKSMDIITDSSVRKIEIAVGRY